MREREGGGLIEREKKKAQWNQVFVISFSKSKSK